jgi:methionine sulfoxide reductase heme-binding subunit
MTPVALSAASSGGSPLWYATRATGVVALVLLTATVVLGIAGITRFSAPGLPRVVTAGLHRNISLLVLGLITVHVLTTVLDSYVHIGLAAAVVPFSSSYRGFWLGLGAVAFDLLIALAVTSLLRDRLSYRVWRGVHWAAYASWPIALWHALGTGTDSRLSWLIALDAGCVGAVAAAAWWRLSLVRPGPGRAVAIAGVLLVPLATAVFIFAGPLQPGWARRAGTPASALGSGAASSSVTASPAPPASPGPAASTAGFAGQVRRVPGPAAGEVTITVDSRIGGTPPRTLIVVLRGAPDGTGLSLSGGTIRVQTAGQQASYQGPVTLLRGHRLAATLHGTDGPPQDVAITLVISGRRASGQLSMRAAGPR